ncbi:MAG: AI-2E family transporter [Anaerolineae bacterium]|nr:AI-2E family transporter [Anaerolineae bacterium]MDH7472974.1 AI-2E family transporter [Anaerolineae bacterium]
MFDNLTPAQTRRLILILILLLIVGWIFYVARTALIPYILGLILVYLFHPLVQRIDCYMPTILRRRRLSRPLSIIVVYLMALLAIAGLMAFLVPVVINQVESLWEQRGELATQGRMLLDEWLTRYRTTIPESWRRTIEDSLGKAVVAIGQAIQEGMGRTMGAVTSTVSLIVGLVIIPFWVFYLLADEKAITSAFEAIIPKRIETDVRNVLRIIDDILSAYLRGQLLLCLAVGIMSMVGFIVIGLDFAVLLGVIIGIFEFIPSIGPILGAIPALIVAVIQSPITALWTILVIFIVQQVENLFLVPRVAGKSVRLHPALVMFVLVIGNEALGLWGMITAVPVTAILRDVFKYLYLRFSDEPVSPQEALSRVRTETVRLDV